MATRTKRSSRQRTQRNTSRVRSEYQKQRALGRERKGMRNIARDQYRAVSHKAPGRADIKQNRKSRILGALHQRVQERRAASAIQSGRMIPSSWISTIAQDMQGYIYVTMSGVLFKSSVTIPISIFDDWKEGKATCITTDSGIIKRWWRGKTPSLGAYYNKHIRGKYKFNKV